MYQLIRMPTPEQENLLPGYDDTGEKGIRRCQ